MSDRTSSPLMILATLTAIVAVVLGIALWRQAMPPWGIAVQWGLAAASFTFTVVYVVHTKVLSRGSIGLLVLAPCSLISHYFVIAAGAFLVISVVAWFLDELL